MKRQDRINVWTAFLHAHEAVTQAIEEDLQRRHGLALTMFEVMHRLEEQPERGLRMQDLADLALLSKSGLTRLVDRMEQAGYVERVSCPSDRRGTYARLTPEGRRVLAAARPQMLEAIRRHFAGLLDRQEAEVLLAVFRKILLAHERRAGLDACGGC